MTRSLQTCLETVVLSKAILPWLHSVVDIIIIYAFLIVPYTPDRPRPRQCRAFRPSMGIILISDKRHKAPTREGSLGNYSVGKYKKSGGCEQNGGWRVKPLEVGNTHMEKVEVSVIRNGVDKRR